MDLNDDGQVNGSDLVLLLSRWGQVSEGDYRLTLVSAADDIPA